MAKVKTEVVIDRRTSVEKEKKPLVDRRKGKEDRRKESVPVAEERRATERREKQPRRRQIDPTTCEREYNVEEVEFMHALDNYKRANGRMFPTCSEILEVIRGLGYVRVSNMTTSELNPAATEASENSLA
jgi:sRNA-binding protein